MIRQIRGTVLHVGLVSAVVEVSGLGLEVRMPHPDALTEGSEATLATHLAVKQDGLELYGFVESADRDFFELIISVPGIGPKTALSVMRKAPRSSIAGAVRARDLGYLTKIVGLGKKSAEKLLVELSDKVGDLAHAGEDAEVFDTLLALGYTEREARTALQSVPTTVVGKEARLKAALARHS